MEEKMELKIMTYNVSHYNCDTAVFLPSEQERNFVDLIGSEFPDFMGIQEGAMYMDSGNSVASYTQLYLPVFPEWYRNGYNANVVFGHKAKGSGSNMAQTVGYTNLHNENRSICFAIYEINSKKILVASTHIAWEMDGDPLSSASINERLAEYTELMQWANSQIPLKRLSDNSNLTLPAHDYSIICMDGNHVTDDDKTNLQTVAAANNFQLCNGGRFGWLNTCHSVNGYFALDNILVSDNILIKSFDVKWDAYTGLYSDHVPCIAELVLKGS